MHYLPDTLKACWAVTEAMAPYLLLGFFISGLLRIALTPAWVRRHMGRPGLWQILKSSLIGVPLPLCSCGVIPVGLSLRKQGASRGATVAFLASTPQTGVDSIAATWSLLGPVVAMVRMIAAFVSGLLAGVLVEWTYPPETAPAEKPTDPNAGPTDPWWKRMWEHGFVTLPRDMARPLLLGILISGLLTVLVPPGFFQDRVPGGWVSYVIMLAVGIPMYVCSTGSIPIAVGFVHMGFSPGAALVFLVAGPATNAATIATLWTRIGKRGTALYLAAIAVSALAAGWATDTWLKSSVFSTAVQRMEHCETVSLNPIAIGFAVILLILILPGLWQREEED
jgi:uncharacterized membrane protein YraQ (UPF0718 family)